MADSKDLIIKRKEAYGFIKNTLRNPPWELSIDISDAQLVEYIMGDAEAEQVSALSSLREGTGNPTKELVSCFKKLCICNGVISESEINQYLVDPFK